MGDGVPLFEVAEKEDSWRGDRRQLSDLGRESSIHLLSGRLNTCSTYTRTVTAVCSIQRQ